MSTSARSFTPMDRKLYLAPRFDQHEKALEQRRSAMRAEEQTKRFDRNEHEDYTR